MQADSFHSDSDNGRSRRRHWLRFSLSTLMIVILILSVPLGWRAMQLKDEQDQRLRRIAAASETPYVIPGRARDVHLALSTTSNVAFDATPLSEIMVSLAKKHSIPIVIAKKALSDIGMGVDIPVTCNSSNKTLSATLDQMLRELDLTHVVTGSVLLITTPEDVYRRDAMIVRVYNIADVIEDESDTQELVRALRDVLAESAPTEPESRRNSYCIGGYKHLLVARSNRLGHKQVEDVLGLIRTGMKT